MALARGRTLVRVRSRARTRDSWWEKSEVTFGQVKGKEEWGEEIAVLREN